MCRNGLAGTDRDSKEEEWSKPYRGVRLRSPAIADLFNEKPIHLVNSLLAKSLLHLVGSLPLPTKSEMSR